MHSKVGVEGYKKSIEEAVATGGKIEFGGNVRFISIWWNLFLSNGFIVAIWLWLSWTKQNPSYFIKNSLRVKIVTTQSFQSDLAFFRAYDESNQLKFWNTFVQFNANFYSPSQEIVHLWENFWNWLKIFVGNFILFLILAHLTFFFFEIFAGDWTWRPLCWTSHRHWPCPWCSRGLAWNLCSHCLRFEM